MSNKIINFFLLLMVVPFNSFVLYYKTIPSPIIFNNKNMKININLYYLKSKNYDDYNSITILPPSQASIIINNWLNATLSVNSNNINKNPIVSLNQNIYFDNLIESSLERAIFDFKVYISMNKNITTSVYFAWIPDSHKQNKQVIYLIAGKIINNQLQINRIAQNPYAIDLININSKDLVEDLHKYYINNNVIKNITYDELHKYDKRYLWSWQF